MLEEVERVEGLRARTQALEQAQLFALAFHDPAKLAGVARELEQERRGVAQAPPSLDEVRQQGAAVLDLVAFAERIERRQRRRRH